MHIAHPCPDAVATAYALRPPRRDANRRLAFASALLILALSPLSAFAQSFVSSFDNINGPTFLAIDSNRVIGGTASTWLYVSEHGNTDNTGGGRILRYNLAAPTTPPVDIGNGHFVSPDGILVDPASGDLIVADRAQDRITRLANDGTIKWTFGSGAAGAPDEMHGPCGLAIDSTGAIYVTEHGETVSNPVGLGGNFVSKYTVSATGQAQRQFRIGGTGSGNGQFANTGPYGVAIVNNQLYVSDGFNARVEVFAADGTYQSQFSLPGILPLGMTVDASGGLWMAESSGQGDGPIERVEKLSRAGASTGIELTTTAPSLALPFDIAIDPATNRAYVSDYGNRRVAVFDLSAASGGTSTGGTSSGGTSSGGASPGDDSGGTTVHVTSVTVPANGAYRAGDALVFKVHFSAPVRIVRGDDRDNDDDDGKSDGPAKGTLSIGWTAVGSSAPALDSGTAVLVGPLGAADLTFKYQVRGNDSAPQGIALDPTLQVSAGAVVTDASGHVLTTTELTLPWPANPLPGVVLGRANDSTGKGSDAGGPGHGNGPDHGKGARFVNLSSRVHIHGRDANRVVVVGFVVAGSGTQSLLVRAVGPGLRGFGVGDTLSDTVLSVLNSAGQVVATNSGWGGDSLIARIAQQVGAFALASGSHDSALVLSLAPGAYTATISGGNHDGEALVEVYDAGEMATAFRPQLVNLSTRGYVEADGNLIVGFVVQGPDAKPVLVRAIGPGLAPFGVADGLSDPQLQVLDASGRVVAKNDDWGTPEIVDPAQPAATASEVMTAAAAAGAFSLAPQSHDAAVVTTLPPGSYTATITGANHAAGAILVEVYQLASP